MNVLLDTHTFLWWVSDPPKLSAEAREVIADGRNTVFVSAASAWEIAIKAQRGKLKLPAEPARFVTQQMAQNGFAGLPVSVAQALHVAGLPDHHRDPFDRLLIAQSQLDDLPIVTADADIRRYDVQTIW